MSCNYSQIYEFDSDSDFDMLCEENANTGYGNQNTEKECYLILSIDVSKL